ncbi:hypothetical protein CIRG_02149 [Coccidioides immitis RMSCC 2394]|uniref:Uncharacterized protein n=1 Tax=Coccidioides immitis RMSCC 2394 TaxID=404692 RepID=A0A0J6Y2T4_COCIT|nr:hypothetical protein CIRG_02149 [Coccidioides immitis RMSCC 2394]
MVLPPSSPFTTTISSPSLSRKPCRALSSRCLHSPNPIQWDVPGRIAELQAMINNPATDEPQKLNLQTAINLYHTKELPGRFKWIQDGKVVRHKDIDFQRPFWVEGYGQQLSSQIMIPATMPEPSFAPSQPMSKCPSNHQLAHRTMYTHYPAGQGLGHEVSIPNF